MTRPATNKTNHLSKIRKGVRTAEAITKTEQTILLPGLRLIKILWQALRQRTTPMKLLVPGADGGINHRREMSPNKRDLLGHGSSRKRTM